MLNMNERKPWLNLRIEDLVLDGTYTGPAPNNIPIANIASGGLPGRFIHDDGVVVGKKAIELPDLQNIGVGAPDGSFLRHNNVGSISFQNIEDSDITPGTEGQVLTSVSGVSTWANFSLPTPVYEIFELSVPQLNLTYDGALSDVVTKSGSSGVTFDNNTTIFTIPEGTWKINIILSITKTIAYVPSTDHVIVTLNKDPYNEQILSSATFYNSLDVTGQVILSTILESTGTELLYIWFNSSEATQYTINNTPSNTTSLTFEKIG